MLRLFMDLAAARLHFEPVPVKLLSVLSQVFSVVQETYTYFCFEYKSYL